MTSIGTGLDLNSVRTDSSRCLISEISMRMPMLLTTAFSL